MFDRASAHFSLKVRCDDRFNFTVVERIYMRISLSILLVISVFSTQVLAEENMLLNWKFDSSNAFGAFEYDATGNNNDGVSIWNRVGFYGGVSWEPGAGFLGGAGYLGEGVRGTISSKNELSLPEEWTISLLIKPLATKLRYDNFLVLKTVGDKGKDVLSIGQSNYFRASFDNNGERVVSQFLRDTMSSEKWNHLALVFEKDQVSFYLNGKSHTNKHTMKWNTSLKSNIFITGFKGQSQNRLEGFLDEFRIYGRALSKKEVLQLGTEAYYNEEVVVPIVDSGLGYTSWLSRGKASFKMYGGLKFKNHNVGDVSYEWKLLSQPKGAKGRFTDPSDPMTTFKTNKAGDYKFKLTASNEAGKDEKFVNGVIFVKDMGPKKSKLYSMPTDRFEGRMVGPHPKRAAALKGKSIAPIAYWSFDKPAKNIARGTGPKAKDIKLPETITYTEKGKIGGALHLVPEHKKSAVLDFGKFPELADEFTISFWAISERTDLKAALFRATGENNKEFWNLKNYHNSSKIPGYSAVRFEGEVAAPVRMEGHWTHFTFSYSKMGEYRKLYINGWLVGSSPNLPLNKGAKGTPQLIFNNIGNNYSLKGMIDEVAIYDKMLNNDEAYKIYTEGVSSLTKRVSVDPYITRSYTDDFIKKYFPEPTASYRAKGFAEERFEGGNLAPYTHPRLNFTMEDLPRIRQSFIKTQHGHNNYAFMYLYSRTLFGLDLENYTPNTRWKEGVTDGMSDPNKNYTSDVGDYSCARLALAYEALMSADSQLARKLIDNMIKAAEIQQPVIDQGLKTGFNEWQGWYHTVLGRRVTQVMYDYLYNWMTESEKAKIRKIIATATAGNWSIGMYAMPALYAHRSNWEAWITGDMMIALQSIYGEEGFSQNTYDETARAVNLCAEIMNDPESGAHYEGMGKSSINATQMSVLSRMQPKGKKTLSNIALYNNLAKFHFHIGVPWSNKLVMYDQMNGGNAPPPVSAINAMHYAYPDDPVMNYLKHCIDDGAISYTSNKPRTFAQESWILSAIYIQDWKGPTDLNEHRKYAAEKAGEPLGYFSDFRGQMVSRSSWEPEALQLNYVARVIKGGHHSPVKGYFVINGLGRQWFEFRSRDNHHSRVNSCVTVDGDGQDIAVARSLSYSGAAKTKGALFDVLSSELTGGYRHIDNKWPTLNYTRLTPDPRPWFDMPKQYLVHWYTGDRPYAPLMDDYDQFDPINYKGKKEFAYAYRSAAFARGKRPYIVIADDFKKDNKMREYIWHAAFPKDFKTNLGAHELNGDTAILTDPKNPTQHMFVKMIGYQGEGEFVIEHVVPTGRSGKEPNTTKMPYSLKFKNQTDTAKFRVLLYAFKNGDPLPEVFGTDDNYTISIGDQKDLLKIDKPVGKGSRLTFERQQ